MAFRHYIAKAHPFAPKAASAPKATDLKAKAPKDPVSKLPSSETTKAPAVPKSKEAQVKDKSPSLPKAAAAPKESAGAGGAKQGKYGQPVQHVDKNRYPKRPNNALGETASTWVIPKGQKPMYNKQEKGAKEESTDSKSSADSTPKLNVKAPAVSETDHGTVKPVDSKLMTPKVAEQSILGQAPTAKPSKPEAGLPDTKEIMSQLKAGKRFEHPDGSKIYSKTDADGNTVAHVAVDGAGKKNVFYSDEELGEHLDKLRGGHGKAIPSADDHRNSAKAAREAGSPEIAAKHEKLASAKEKMAEKTAGKPERKDFESYSEFADANSKWYKDQKDGGKKGPKSKEEQDLETADKEAAKFREKLMVRKDKAKAAEKNKLERQKNSSDDKVVNDARKELAAKAEERKRVNKQPDSPDAHAAHQLHTSKAKESLKKVDDLLKDPELSDLDKQQLHAVKSALDVHSKQKHEPNSEESKKLNGMAKVVNHMHGNQQKKIKGAEREQKKEVKLKVKEEIAQKKEGEKKIKEDQKAKQQAAKESEKQAKEAAKAAGAGNVSQDIEAHQQQPKAANKVGLGAFHSGRAAGEAASNNAAADSGAGLGHQATSGAVSGIASAGHKLLGGKEERETRYTVKNKKDDVKQSGMQTVSKSLWHNDIEETSEESESVQMIKSLTGNFRKSFCPVSDRETEFLAVECGFSMDRIQKGLVSVHGKLEGRYAEWLCKKTQSAIDDLRGSLKSE